MKLKCINYSESAGGGVVVTNSPGQTVLEGAGTQSTKALRTVGRGVDPCGDRAISKEHISLSWSHSNIVCCH